MKIILSFGLLAVLTTSMLVAADNEVPWDANPDKSLDDIFALNLDFAHQNAILSERVRLGVGVNEMINCIRGDDHQKASQVTRAFAESGSQDAFAAMLEAIPSGNEKLRGMIYWMIPEIGIEDWATPTSEHLDLIREDALKEGRFAKHAQRLLGLMKTHDTTSP